MSSGPQSPIFKEAVRLHKMGFAIHWLYPRLKRPIESGWTTGPRKTLKDLIDSYQSGFNVGTRLGKASKLSHGYLAVCDVDVKSELQRHREEAHEAAKAFNHCPMVISGRGNGSKHHYFVTDAPFKTLTPYRSTEEVKVVIHSKKPSKRELKELTEEEIKKGIRIAWAWEVALYSEGRQVVLPPSLHPENNRAYKWATYLESAQSIPSLTITHLVKEKEKEQAKTDKVTPLEDFKVSEIDLAWVPISDAMRVAIQIGVGVTDRSAYLLKAASALLSAGLDTNEVLTVLTDPTTHLGACAYDHTQSNSRQAAARWVWKYTLQKIVHEKEPENVFKEASVEEVKKLPEAEPQSLEIDDGSNWMSKIIRGGRHGEGHPKALIENVVLILTKTGGEKVIRRNIFAFRDVYECDTPWGGKKGDSICDDDTVFIKIWLGQNFRFEPNSKVIEESLVYIAKKNSYDPVVEWLDSLPAWDETPRLDTWLKNHFEAKGDPEYLAQVFRKWMVAMVMRAKRPGSKFDWMPIFEGLQGIGKSSFGRELVGENHFLDWLPNLQDKDSALALQGMWCVEMGELANLRKTEIETVKGYLTRKIDKVRPPFGKRLIESARRCVFFGTTNRDTYLTDDTGNRRIKPVEVGKLNFKMLAKERNQLFAEALFIFNNEKDIERYLDLTGDAKDFELKIHEQKRVQDESHIMAEILQDFIEKTLKENPSFDFEKVRIMTLFTGVGPLTKWALTQRNMNFAANAIKHLGGKKRIIMGYSYWNLPVNEKKHLLSTDISTIDFY